MADLRKTLDKWGLKKFPQSKSNSQKTFALKSTLEVTKTESRTVLNGFCWRLTAQLSSCTQLLGTEILNGEHFKAYHLVCVGVAVIVELASSSRNTITYQL